MAMTSCHNIDEQMSQKRDDQMSDEQLSHNRPTTPGDLDDRSNQQYQNEIIMMK